MHRKVIKSFAKINLFLNVVSKKKKFHRIQSLFSFIDLHDRIEISTINRKKHFIKFDGKFSKGISKKNSIYTLLKILDQKRLIKKKYYIKVTKNIPQKSGMGGGSMNAASILKFFLKRKIVISKKKRILEICEIVGNDVKIGLYKGPIFLNSNNSIQSLKKGLRYHLLIFKPKVGCSTKYIFSKFKNFSKKIPSNKKNLLKLNNKKNDLEPIVLKKFRNISKPLFFLKSLKGIEFVRMTGSGSSFIAYFKSKKNLLNASKLFTNKYKKYWSVMSKTI